MAGSASAGSSRRKLIARLVRELPYYPQCWLVTHRRLDASDNTEAWKLSRAITKDLVLVVSHLEYLYVQQSFSPTASNVVGVLPCQLEFQSLAPCCG